MSTPTIGLVVAAHNSAQTIAAAIASVLAQTRLPDHIVVVDTSPRDDGADIARATLEKSPTQWQVVRVKNTGPGGARNRGWRAANTDWIQFLDADDVISPAKLAVQMAGAVEAERDVAFVHGPWQRQRLSAGMWVPDPVVHFAAESSDLLVNLLRADYFIPAAAGLMRTWWLDSIGGFDDRHWLLEDIDLYIRLASAGAQFEALPHPHPLFFYRVRDDSLSRSSHAAFARAIARNADLVEREFGSGRAMPAEVAQRVAEMYWQAAYGLADNGEEFTDLVARIARLHPARNPVDKRNVRMLLRIVGPRATSRIIRTYRWARRRAGIPDTR
jgi:glycosyltransferase involved in cell wall biosynthesis